MKTCSKCGAEKALAFFARDKTGALGHSARCKECAYAANKKWRECNQDHITQKRKEYYAENRDTRLAKAAEYAAQNKESVRLRQSKWREENSGIKKQMDKTWAANNRGRVNANIKEYKAKRMSACPVWANKDRIRDVYVLADEFAAAGFDVHVDHIEPLRGKFVCGLHVEHNLRVCLADANRSKGNRQLEYFQ